MNYPVLTPRAGGVRARAKKRLFIALLSVACGWIPMIVHATVRDWTGSASAAWSNPNNWDPVGSPQDGDYLRFWDGSNRSMINDVPNLSVEGLDFNYHDYVLSGNPLTVGVLGGFSSEVNARGYSSHSVTINCALILAGGTLFDSGNTGISTLLRLNADINLNGHSMSMTVASGGRIEVAGSITGDGDVLLPWYSNVGTIEFLGTADNTFTGRMIIDNQSERPTINFNKQAGAVVKNRLDLLNGIIVHLLRPDQIGDNAVVSLSQGSQLLLHGNSDTIGSLIMTNFHADADATRVDTRNGASTAGVLTLNGGITSWVFNDAVTPVLQGIVSLPLGDHAFNMISPFGYAGFDMQAEVRGQGGFTKSGNGALFLLTSNSYSGLTVVSEGFVDARQVRAFGTGANGVQLNGGGMILRNLSIATETLTVTGAGSLIETYGNCTWSGSITLNQQLNINSETSFQLPGVIIGSGGLSLAGNTIELSGSLPNSFTGPTRSDCALLSLNKSSGGTTYAMSGPLIIGQNTAAPAEVRWGGHWQINRATTLVTLHPSALMNLNAHDDTIGSLTFNGGTVQNGGLSTLNLSRSVTANAANVTANINGGRFALAGGNRDFTIEDGPLEPDLAISAIVSDFGGITKNGAGSLRLSAANTFLGAANINAGLIHIQNDTGLGSTLGPTTVADGATLLVEIAGALAEPLTLSGPGRYGTDGALKLLPGTGGNSPITLAAPASVRVDSAFAILSGVISGPGSFVKLGAGALQLGGGSGTANTFTGDMIVNEGSVVLFKPPFVRAVGGSLVVGATNDSLFPPAAQSRHFNPGQVSKGIVVNRRGLVDLNGFDEYINDLTLNGGGDLQTGAGTLYLGSNVVVNPGSLPASSELSGRVGLFPGPHRFIVGANASAAFTTSADLEVPAVLFQESATADLVKEGFGTMRLRAANAFAGATTVNDGTLIVSNNAALGSTTAGTFVNNRGSLALDGGVWVQEETLTLNSTNPAAFLSMGNFSNTWVAPVTLQSTAGINVAGAGGVLNIYSFFDCCGGSYISGPGGLTKTGPGKLLIAGFFGSGYDGPTTVTGGTLEASRFQGGSLRGNVVVEGAGSVLSTLKLNAFATASQLSSTGTVTLRNGGAWNLGPTNAESVRALTGDGAVNLANVSSLTVNNAASNDFSGSFAGGGSLIKQGAGSLTLRGNSPSFTGPTTVSGGNLIVHGSMPGSAVTVNAGSLRGSGTVGSATLSSSTEAAPEPATPLTLGVALTMASLNEPSGSALQLDFFGATVGAGNDVARVSTGGVTLAGTLSPNFRYAPREGDVFTVIDKQSAGAVSGAFSGLPQNTIFTGNGIPTRISYTGGSGNDVTLTVTNLALGYSGYRLAEGNGNQSVEPDECNLLFVSLVNRRTGRLTLTNAVLRSLTPGVVVTIANAGYPAIPAGAARENLAPFQFRTAPTLACGTPVEFELIVGVLGEGVFAVAFTPVSGNDCAHPTGGCESCFTVTGSFSNATLTTTRPLDFPAAPSSCLPARPCPQTNFTDVPAVRYVSYAFTNSATNEVCVTVQMRVDCANPLGVVAYLGTNDVNDPCANYLGDSGVLHGSAFSFRVPPNTNFVISIVARTTNAICGTHTLEVFGLPCPPPRLHIAKDTAPDKVLLHWSTASPGWTLQQTGKVPGTFSNAPPAPVISGGEYVQTNSATGTNQFYRLTK